MNKNNHEYFAHEADIGVIGRGQTIEEAFISSASATFAIMTDLTQVQTKQTVNFEFEEDDLEFAFVIWLNRLLTEAKCNNLIFSQFKIQRKNSHWLCQAQGEPWRDSLVRGTEVKGATLTALEVKQDNEHWEARCVVDV